MSIGINRVNVVTFGAKKTQTQEKENKDPKSFKEFCEQEGIEIPKLTPLQQGLGSAAVWGVSGFIFDRLINLLPFKVCKTPLKTSLGVNGVIAGVAGIVGFVSGKLVEKAKDKALKEEQSQEVQK